MQSSIAITAHPVAAARSHAHVRSSRYQKAASCALAALVALSVVVAVISLAMRPGTPAPRAWATVRVTPYASLWDLASSHPVEGLDTASTVALIRAENDLTSATLSIGQTIRVPAPEHADTAVALR